MAIDKIKLEKIKNSTGKICNTKMPYKIHKDERGFWKKICYAIIPFVVFIVILGITFFGNQLLNKPGTDYPRIPIDDMLPPIESVAWMVYFYFLTFPVGILVFFWLAYVNKKRFFDIILTLIISFAISGVIYFFWQTQMTKPPLEPSNFTNKFLIWTWGATNPTNCFPSQHSFMAIAMTIACLSVKNGKAGRIIFKILVFIEAIMIILSTFMLRQHFFVDWIASCLIMIPTYFFIRAFQFGDRVSKKTYKTWRLKQ